MGKKATRWLIAIAVTALAAPIALTVVPTLLFVWAVPDPNSVELDKPAATQLVRDFAAYGKIARMDDCTRSQKYLNDIAIRMTATIPESDTLPEDETMYYKEALRQQGIAEATFEDFRKRLESTQLRDYHRTGFHSLFVVDGYMGHSWGYLHAAAQQPQQQQQLQVGNHLVTVLEPLGDNWYRVGGH